MSIQAAPGELERVRERVNTLHVENGTDALSDPAALREWLRGHGLLSGGTVRPEDLIAARTLRDAIRVLLLEQSGVSVRKQAALALNHAAAKAALEPRFDPAGAYRLEPGAAGVPGALGRLLAIVAAAMGDGTWQRLKVCRADDCRWAFYDRARNRSRHWCSMAVCGNRTKARAYRRRHAV